MKQLKPKYYTVINGQSGLAEVQCSSGTVMDNLPNMEVAKLVAALADLGHLYRDPDSAILFLLEQPLTDGMELDTIEDWAAYSQGETLDGLVSDDAPAVVEEEQPSLPVQKVGV
jgi:hypothetical protein